jgi:predicted DCC family thiol-disulfide oxidoreductase YuxK
MIMAEGSPQAAKSHLILYDGVCGLCNRLNAFVLKHDTKAHFRFASLQSVGGRALLRQWGRNPDDLDTFYVLANFSSESARLFERAQAGLFVLKTLGRPWSWAGVLGVLPRSLLDYGYDAIAHNRYRIFGKYDRCMLPSAEHRGRFIDV